MSSAQQSARIPRTSLSVLWAGVSQGGRVLIQLAGLAVLSHLLPVSDFGLVALASIVTNFAMLLRDMGTSAAIIQRDQLSERLLDTVFWFNVLISTGLGFLVLTIGVPAGWVFDEPRLPGILAALAICFPLGGLGSVHQAILERSFRFKALARIELACAVLGLLGAVVSAWYGAGAYSLVLMTVLTTASSSILLWIVSPWRPHLLWDSNEFRTLRGFTDNLLAFQIVNYFSRNADTMLIGRFLGAEPLGWYNMAYKLMLFPVQNLSTVMGRALLPVASRAQRDHERLRFLYLKAMSSIALITAPLMVGLWVLREPFVLAILGEDWVPVSLVLAWLAPVGLAQSLVSPVGLLYMATGRTDLMVRAGAGVTLINVTGMLLGLRWGYVGVAAGYAIANMIIMIPCAAIPFSLIDLKFRSFLKTIASPLLASIAMGLVVWTALTFWGVEREHPIIQFTVLVALGMAFFVSFTVLFMKSEVESVMSIIKDSIKELPVIGDLAKRVYRRFVLPENSPFIGSANYWESRYASNGNSGVGSYGKFADFKAETLNAFVAENNVRTVMEMGCGDGNQLKLARYPQYLGLDVSPTAVEQCRRLFKGDNSKSFLLASTYRGETADLVLSLDVIFHLVENEIFEKYMEQLFRASKRYVIIYSSNFDEDTRRDGQHVRHRKFTDWIGRHCPSWKLIRHLPNKYPYHGDHTKGSFADFYFYERVDL